MNQRKRWVLLLIEGLCHDLGLPERVNVLSRSLLAGWMLCCGDLEALSAVLVFHASKALGERSYMSALIELTGIPPKVFRRGVLLVSRKLRGKNREV